MKFRRIKKDSVFFGVCTGIQDLFKQKGFNVDVYLIRFIILILVIALPVVNTIIIGSYFVAALIFPTKEDEDEEKELDLTKKDDENDPS